MLNFVQPWMLWGLLAVIVPLLIHLINRWRHKSVYWAAMDFLIRASKEMRGVKKLRYYLILASRVLAVAALAFALSRPRVSNWLGFGGSVVDNVIIILDRSASMDGKVEGEKRSVREIALERLKNTMSEMGSARFFLLESAGGKFVELSAPEVLPTLEEASGTDTAADIPVLIEKAASYISGNLSGTSEIWIASDMQASNWSKESSQWEIARGAMGNLPSSMIVRIMGLRDRTFLNRSIRATNARIKGGELLLSMEVHQYAPPGSPDAPKSLPVTISVNGGRVVENIQIQGGLSLLEKRIALPDNVREGYGYIQLPQDGNERDNYSFFTFVQDRPAKVAATGEPGEALNITLSMAAPPGLSSRIAERKSPEALVKSSIYDISLLLWLGKLPKGLEAEHIREYVEKGGIVLFLPSEESFDETEFMGLKWGRMEESPRDKLFLISQWDREMGLLRDGSDGRAVPVDHVMAILRSPTLGEGLTTASWDDGSPAILRKVAGAGQIIMLGTLPLYEWSNLADGYVYLPLLQRLVEEGSMRFSMPNAHDLGTWNLPLQSGQEALCIDGREEGEKKATEYTAGVYRIGSNYYALNRPASEDIMEEIMVEDLRDLFGTVRFTSLESNLRETDSLVSEIWRTFYYFLIIFFLLEGVLSLPVREKKKKNF